MTLRDDNERHLREFAVATGEPVGDLRPLLDERPIMTDEAPQRAESVGIPPLLEHAKIHEAARRTEAEARVCSQVDMTYTLTFGDFVEQRVGCPGDGRYQPPGRGHLEGCQHDAVKWVWEDVRPVAPHACHHDEPEQSNWPASEVRDA